MRTEQELIVALELSGCMAGTLEHDRRLLVLRRDECQTLRSATCTNCPYQVGCELAGQARAAERALGKVTE